jgi:membrane associated rhomboid family serine protease
MSSIPNTIARLYIQFLIIIAIAFVFSFILNGIFMIGDPEMRIAMSSAFLALFTGSLMLLRKI